MRIDSPVVSTLEALHNLFSSYLQCDSYFVLCGLTAKPQESSHLLVSNLLFRSLLQLRRHGSRKRGCEHEIIACRNGLRAYKESASLSSAVL